MVAAALVGVVVGGGIVFAVTRSSERPGYAQSKLVCQLVGYRPDSPSSFYNQFNDDTNQAEIAGSAALAPPSTGSPYLEVIVAAKAYGSGTFLSREAPGKALIAACSAAGLPMTVYP